MFIFHLSLKHPNLASRTGFLPDFAPYYHRHLSIMIRYGILAFLAQSRSMHLLQAPQGVLSSAELIMRR
jgi:hypothetical protein